MLVGLTGVGGGSLMTPLLTLLFGINPTVAVGTDLAFASITKSAGTIAHRVRNNVHWEIVRRLCLGALPAAVLATLALKYYGALDKQIGQIIRYTIAFSVLLTVVAIIFRGRMIREGRLDDLLAIEDQTEIILRDAPADLLEEIAALVAAREGASLIRSGRPRTTLERLFLRETVEREKP